VFLFALCSYSSPCDYHSISLTLPTKYFLNRFPY
jgi:hypothetical protein